MKGSGQELPKSELMPWTSIGGDGKNYAWTTMWTRTSKLGMIPSQLSKSLASGTVMGASLPCITPSNITRWKTPYAQWARRMPDWGGPDPRKDHNGNIDFRIQRQLNAYKKSDDPPRRVKQVPIIIIVYILNMAYDAARDVASMSIADMICIAFFFLLRPR
jgi:hypothetical protein